MFVRVNRMSPHGPLTWAGWHGIVASATARRLRWTRGERVSPMPRAVFHVVMLMALALAVSAGPAPMVAAQSQPTQELPPIELDALDPSLWSMSEIVAAPGQVIRITNRGVQVHTFAVWEWSLDVRLPTLETVDVVIPSTARPGDVVIFFCSEPGHRELGQEGKITIVDAATAQALAGARQHPNEPGSDRVVIETSDALAWSINAVEVAPGQIIEVRNNVVLEHHFAIDEWGVNETISAGEVKLIPVPDDVTIGATFVFYCSVPDHRPAGMEGTLTIIEGQRTQSGIVPGPPGRVNGPDLDRFLPQANVFGAGWNEVRTGNARAVIPDFDGISSQIFPGEGRGATFVGLAGSRSTIVVLPFAAANAPTNQIEDAILNVQVAMMEEWETDLANNAALDRVEPPAGCDIANRASGITRVYTLPAGSTVCQLRSAGIVIFVAVEGQVGEWTSVEAADQIILRLLQVT